MSFELTDELKTGLLNGTLPPGIALPVVVKRSWWERLLIRAMDLRGGSVVFELRYDRFVIRRDGPDEFSVWCEAKGVPVMRLSCNPVTLDVGGTLQLLIDGRMEGALS